MGYMLLVLEPLGQRAERGEAAGRVLYDRMLAFGAELDQRGVLIASHALTSEQSSVRVQVREGERRLLDGPFAEAKEMVGGYFLLNCASRDEAIEIATQCPAAQWCTIEVRELGPCFM
jgi:hypothetical protein